MNIERTKTSFFMRHFLDYCSVVNSGVKSTYYELIMAEAQEETTSSYFSLSKALKI